MSLPDSTSIRAAARAIVADMTGASVADDEPIISAGLIDSLSILRLISRLEAQLRVTLPAETLQPDDFDTLDLIVETVERVGRAK